MSEMLDGLAGHGLRPPLVVADSGYGDSGPFRSALDERGITYSVQVKVETFAHPADAAPVPPTWSGQGRPATRADYPHNPVGIAQHVLTAGRDTATTATWRAGSKGTLSSQFVLLRVRPAGHRITRDTDGTLPERWLIAEWPDDETKPVTYWLTSQPTDLIRTAKIRWRIEHDYRELKPASAWTTSKAAHGQADTATSPSSPPRTRSSPCCDTTQKRMRRPAPLTRS